MTTRLGTARVPVVAEESHTLEPEPLEGGRADGAGCPGTSSLREGGARAAADLAPGRMGSAASDVGEDAKEVPRGQNLL